MRAKPKPTRPVAETSAPPAAELDGTARHPLLGGPLAAVEQRAVGSAPADDGNPVALRSRLGRVLDAIVPPVGRSLAACGLTADTLTALGLVLTGVSAALLVTGRPAVAGWVLVAAGLSDMLDGAVARARGQSGPLGAFYDSVADRVSDGAILAALAWHVRSDPGLFALAAAALVGAQVTSYTRARAESLGADCSVGLLERPERAILVMAGLVFGDLLEVVLWVLAAGALVTVVQRVAHVRRQLRAPGADRTRPDRTTSGSRPE